MPTCAVKSCKNNQRTKGRSYTFYRFPQKDPVRRREWIRRTGHDDYEPTPNCRVCSAHFEEHCFDRSGPTNCLKKGAMPTLLCNYPYSEHHKESIENKDQSVETNSSAVLQQKSRSVSEDFNVQHAEAQKNGQPGSECGLGEDSNLQHSEGQETSQSVEEDGGSNEQQISKDSNRDSNTVEQLSIDKDVLHRWRQLGETYGLSSDTDIAQFLLQRFDDKATANSRKPCIKCGAPLMLVCITCKQRTQQDVASSKTSADCLIQQMHLEHSYVSSVPDDSSARDDHENLQDTMQEDTIIDSSVTKGSLTHNVRFAIENQKLVPLVVLERADGKRNCLQEKAIISTREMSSGKLQLVDADVLVCNKNIATVTASDYVFTDDHNYFQNSKSAQSEDMTKKKRERPLHYCSGCREGFKKKKQLQAHLEIETENKQYTCSVCQAVFRKFGCLRTHKLRNHKDMFVCKMCAESFPCMKDLARHKPQHQFKCTVCRQYFKSSSLLNTHMQEEHKLELYKCETCSMEFHCAEKLKKHVCA
ncbi:hypothetical protein BaRGS_00010885 [Batillaria attramentaria]|uniref:Uncharacterized protein n=1 Tax=Batillaria attramentaria TaxID=370345 RepID=A0ABD0LEI7_9CAEN